MAAKKTAARAAKAKLQAKSGSHRSGAPGFVDPMGPMPNLSFMKLRKTFNGKTNDIIDYYRKKAMLDRDPATIDGLRPQVAVALPPGSPGKLIDPIALLTQFQADLLPREQNLAVQWSIYAPRPASLWDEFDRAYQFARTCIAAVMDLPVIVVQHAPFYAGSNNAPHLHLLILAQKLEPHGFTVPERSLVEDEGQLILRDAWEKFRSPG